MKRKITVQMISLLLLALLALAPSSCIRETGFKWDAVKLSQTEMQLTKGEQKEFFLYGVPERFTVEWTSSNKEVAEVTTSQYLNKEKGQEKIQVSLLAKKEGNATLTATITCPKNKVKKLLLHVTVKEGGATPDPQGNIQFQDANLQRMILEAKPDVDADKDGEISLKEAKTVVELKLGFETKEEVTPDKKITSLEGLQYFTNLESLDLKNQFVSEAQPIEKLSNLIYLRLAGNELKAINLTELTKLEDLRLFGNKQLKEIDLSRCLYLKGLYLQDTSIKELDLTKHKKLELALLNRSKLERVTFDGLPLLENISLVENNLTELSATHLPKLKELHANSNRLTKVTLDGVPSLERLNLYKNQLTDIQFPKLPKLMFLFLFDNQLKAVDLSNLPMLFTFAVSSNPLVELDFSKNPIIRNLEAEQMAKLEKINLYNGNYSDEAEYLILEGNTALKEVIVDKGDEATHVKNIFKNSPSVKITEK